ncbi:MAG: hypothetical protein IPK81_21560 [Rhodospirillales bacterium]|nr:MAG: hypothetical protein IPK81_21560 [Rhodospirillales bacterium]
MSQPVHATDRMVRDASPAPQPVAAAAASQTPSGWRALLVSGNAWTGYHDAAVVSFGQRLASGGDTRVTALAHAAGSPVERVGEVGERFRAMGERPDEACLVFLTGHGGRHGVQIQRGRSSDVISPSRLDGMVSRNCGDRPTVVVVSSCNSGVYVGAFRGRENVVVITASRSDTVSYTGSAVDNLTIFDSCLLRALSGGARTWEEAFAIAAACAGDREAQLGVTPSGPQMWVGSRVRGLATPGFASAPQLAQRRPAAAPRAARHPPPRAAAGSPRRRRSLFRGV